MFKEDFNIYHSIVAFLLFVSISPKLSSQEINWELTNGPKSSGGTYLNIYALGSTRDGYVFAGTNGLGVFKSTDMGENWENCSSSLFSNATVSYLVVDNEDNVFIATNLGLYKSSDYGQNWVEMFTGSPRISFQSLAVGANGLTFAGQQGGIYRSTDYGNNWTFAGLDSCIVWVIKIHNDSIVVAGTVYDGPLISTDKGDSWDSINNGLDRNHIVGMSISKNGDLFVGVYDGIFWSFNWGENWECVLTSTSWWIGAIYIHLDKFIFAGSRGEGIYLSSDNGSNWIIVNSGINNLLINSFCGNGEGFVFAGSDSGVYVSSQPITSIENINSGITSFYLLDQNYPNPFNPTTTTIKYTIPERTLVGLKVYDILGNEVAVLVNEEKDSGYYEINFDAAKLSSGVYFYQIKAGKYSETKKMILLK